MEKLNLLDKIIKESKTVIFKKVQPGHSFGNVGRYMSAYEALRRPVAATRPEVTGATLRVIHDEVDSEASSIQSDSVASVGPMVQASRYLDGEELRSALRGNEVHRDGSTTTAASC